MIARQPELQFAGLQGFAGNAQHTPDPAERKAAAQNAADKLIALRDALAAEGLSPAIITGSGTGTQNFDASGPYTELQVGSYIFMDADYDRIRDERNQPPPFEPSLFVLATVTSVNRPGEVTVDAGTKALATCSARRAARVIASRVTSTASSPFQMASGRLLSAHAF
jgi:D-serine deaminase-like pyridoxal phosphate-dependent protein